MNFSNDKCVQGRIQEKLQSHLQSYAVLYAILNAGKIMLLEEGKVTQAHLTTPLLLILGSLKTEKNIFTLSCYPWLEKWMSLIFNSTLINLKIKIIEVNNLDKQQLKLSYTDFLCNMKDLPSVLSS